MSHVDERKFDREDVRLLSNLAVFADTALTIIDARDGGTLLIVLAVAGWFFGADAARGELFAQVKGILGADAAAAMQDIVGHAHYAGGSGLVAVISVALLAVGASATFTSLNTALDVIFDAKSMSGIAGIALRLCARLMSSGLVMGLGFFMVVSLVLDAAIQFAGRSR